MAARSRSRDRLSRNRLCCSNTRCDFLVHPDTKFGSFCCKKCYYRWSNGTSTSKESKQHGGLCEKRKALEGAIRLEHPIAPDEPFDFAGGTNCARGSQQIVSSLNEPTAEPATKKPCRDIAADKPITEHSAEKPCQGIASNKPISEPLAAKPCRGGAPNKPIADALARKPCRGIVQNVASEASSASIDGLKLIRKSMISGPEYGESTFKLYEARASDSCLAPGSKKLLFVWLHGMDMTDISPRYLHAIHGHLSFHTYFFVPISPKNSPDGAKFHWALRYTKRQNKSQLSFVYGKLCEPYLDDICDCIQNLKSELGADLVSVMGYSMGGFGVYHLIGHSPQLFDIAVPLAGYGIGTTDPSDCGHHAPQPEASDIFKQWLQNYINKFKKVPLHIVHARADADSSFRDAVAIAAEVRERGGDVQLFEVSDSDANSDPGKNKKMNGHRYMDFSLKRDSSEKVLWKRFHDVLLSRLERNERCEPCLATRRPVTLLNEEPPLRASSQIGRIPPRKPPPPPRGVSLQQQPGGRRPAAREPIFHSSELSEASTISSGSGRRSESSTSQSRERSRSIHASPERVSRVQHRARSRSSLIDRHRRARSASTSASVDSADAAARTSERRSITEDFARNSSGSRPRNAASRAGGSKTSAPKKLKGSVGRLQT